MSQNTTSPKSLKSWSDDDKPREKMESLGPEALSLSELIAILIRSGSPDKNAVDLSKEILSDANNDITTLSRYTLEDLTQYRGIGMAKAITIKAALELGKRRQLIETRENISTIRSSQDAYNHIKTKLMDLSHEEFWCIFLNRANRVIGQKQISSGGTSGTVVDPKILFKMALNMHATAIILCHNHPSGNLKPSSADIRLTQKIQNAGALLEIKILDHLIVTSESYFSFADEGMI